MEIVFLVFPRGEMFHNKFCLHGLTLFFQYQRVLLTSLFGTSELGTPCMLMKSFCGSALSIFLHMLSVANRHILLLTPQTSDVQLLHSRDFHQS